MKKTFYLFAVLVFAGFNLASCSSDDNKGGGDTDTSIVGKWEYFKEGGEINGNEFLNDYYGHIEGCPKDYIEFKSDGTKVRYDYYGNTGTECLLETHYETYEVEGNIITTTDFGGQEYEVLELTISTLKLRYDSAGNTYIDVFKKMN